MFNIRFIVLLKIFALTLSLSDVGENSVVEISFASDELNHANSEGKPVASCIDQACIEHCDVDSQNCCPGMFCEYDIVFQDNRCIPKGMVCNPVDFPQQSCGEMKERDADGHSCGDRITWLENYKGYSDAQAYKQVNSEYPSVCVCDNPPSATDGNGVPVCVFDIDGTLLGVNEDLSRHAIQACKDKGYNLAVNTAEDDSECAGNRSKLKNLGLDVPDEVYTCLVNYDWGTSKSMNMRTISSYYRSAPQCTLLFDDTGGNVDAVIAAGWSGQKVYNGISADQLQSGLNQLQNCKSAPKPTPQPSDCTGEGSDPWATGKYKNCCSGLKSCLKKWDPTRASYYLCKPQSESGCYSMALL